MAFICLYLLLAVVWIIDHLYVMRNSHSQNKGHVLSKSLSAANKKRNIEDNDGGALSEPSSKKGKPQGDASVFTNGVTETTQQSESENNDTANTAHADQSPQEETFSNVDEAFENIGDATHNEDSISISDGIGLEEE